MERGDTLDRRDIVTWPHFREIFPLISVYLPSHELFHCLTNFANLESLDKVLKRDCRYVTVDTDNRLGVPKEVFMNSMKEYLRKEIKAKGKRLYGCRIRNCNLDTNPTLVNLINTAMQPTLAKLEINVKTVCGVETFHKIMRIAGKNLIELSIAGLSPDLAYIPVFDEHGEKIIFPHLAGFTYHGKTILFLEVCKSFPRMGILSVGNPQTENPESFNDIKMPRLTQIHLRGHINSPILQDHLDCISALGLKLTKIDIMNTHKDLTAATLRGFLESYKETVDDLHLGHFDVAAPPERTREPVKAIKSPFPANLPGVIKACFHKHYIDNLATVLQSMPNLEQLRFNFGMEANWKGLMVDPELKAHKNLNKLMLTWIHPPTVLGRLGEIFPNLVDLQLDTVTDDQLRHIFGSFLNLKYLKLATVASPEYLYDMEAGSYYLHSDYIGDRAMTGLKDEIIKSLPGDSNLIIGPKVLPRQSPYIGSLKKLKYLDMVLPRFRLTSKAFIYGILEARNLQKLKLEARDFNSCPEMIKIMENSGFSTKNINEDQTRLLKRVFRRRLSEIGSEGHGGGHGSDYESGEGSAEES